MTLLQKARGDPQGSVEPIIIDGLILYDIKQASKLLQLCTKTMRLLLKTGKIKGKKIGKKWLVSADAIKEYFNETNTMKGGTKTE